MPLVPTDDTTGVAPAFWTPSIAKSADDSDEARTAGADSTPEPPADGTGHRAAPPPATEPADVAGSPPADDGRSAADAEPEVNPTADTQALRSLGDDALPVFLDTTGRRRRRVRALLWLVSLAGLTYAAVLVLSLLSGHDAQSLGAPDFRPGERSPAATGAPVASTGAAIPRTTAPAAERPVAPDGSRAPDPQRAATTPAEAPRSRAAAPSRPAAAPATPATPPATSAQPADPPSPAPPSTPSTPAASASPGGGIVDRILDTLFP
ncbi:hypothetical protein [Cryptosporangium japonicum]|uniref:Uncharacterized protein n=1 Tax=Cryptosporangium japonicum TaxID=80872 RepID=A0ABP3EG93_9ACTN